MKRFYKAATAEPAEGGHGVRLDAKPVRTPAGAPLVVPGAALAAAIAAEWNGQGAEIVPSAMPLTQLANTAIDRVGPQRREIAAATASYAGTDLVCYRADRPASLVECQATVWQPLVEWAAGRFDAALLVHTGIMPRPQPESALAALAAAVERYDDWRLTALAEATALAGSLVIGLALAEGRLDAEAAFEAAEIDRSHQIERWGADEEATAQRAALRADLVAVRQFLDLLE